jgi:hypothetical protein
MIDESNTVSFSAPCRACSLRHSLHVSTRQLAAGAASTRRRAAFYRKSRPSGRPHRRRRQLAATRPESPPTTRTQTARRRAVPVLRVARWPSHRGPSRYLVAAAAAAAAAAGSPPPPPRAALQRRAAERAAAAVPPASGGAAARRSAGRRSCSGRGRCWRGLGAQPPAGGRAGCVAGAVPALKAHWHWPAASSARATRLVGARRRRARRRRGWRSVWRGGRWRWPWSPR